MMMSDENKADLERQLKFANEKMWGRLTAVLNIAEDAIRNQPQGEENRFAYFSAACSEIKAQMLLLLDKKPDAGHPPAESAEVAEKKDDGWHPLEIPECGIDFKRYYSPDCEVYICAWQSKGENIAHVYEVRCRKLEDGSWRAVLSNDGRKLCSLAATGRHTAYMLALGAMRAYLRRGHRKTISKAEKAAAALADARSDAAGAN